MTCKSRSTPLLALISQTPKAAVIIASLMIIAAGLANAASESAPPPATEPSKAVEAEPLPSNYPAMRAEPKNKSTAKEADKDTIKTQISIERSKPDERMTAELKPHCQRHFPGFIQNEVRAACISVGSDFEKLTKLGGSSSLIQTRCRLNYGEEPRLVMACLIGSKIAEDLAAGQDSYKRKLELCAESYPVHNEIDAFLQESCLTGMHLPALMNTNGRERFESCAQITPERSFIGPCAVGLSLAQDLAQESKTKVDPASQNKMCERYFNLNRFHKGYRACLSARSLAPETQSKYVDVIRGCTNIMSEANNETERAACLVGLSIHRNLSKSEDITKRYQKCGDNKVTYQDRDFLACLTAASLLDFTDKDGAEAGCREIFKELKSHSRSDCVNSLHLF